jgi:hypothetical protein
VTGAEIAATWDATLRVLRQPPPPVIDGQEDAFPTLELTLPAAAGQESLFTDVAGGPA